MKQRILIVEDEPTLLGILVDKFKREGFETLMATNGRIGLDTALKRHPDVIVLDIVMPVMNGMIMLDELRKDEWGKEARVILLTNLSDSEKEMVSKRLGVSDYIIKCDTTMDDLIDKVKRKLGKKDNQCE